jgi:sugar phosphate isomerase/epimerase
LNLDVGHYFGVTGQSPVPVIEKYHDRISSLHLKDRKGPVDGKGGPNMPFGQGETPLKEILKLMKQKKYKFPASIEYEYETPQGSDVLSEMKKCVQYAKDALS